VASIGEVRAFARVPHDVAPGQEVTLTLTLTLPETDAPGWNLTFSLVEQNVAWFEDHGVAPLLVEVGRAPVEDGPTAAAQAVARRANNWSYQPSQGVARGRDGRPYPLFVREARGCRVRDLDGNEWIDYVMGWGAALLGYAHPQVQAAAAAHLDSGAVLSLPHELEMQLTQALCDRFPGAEAVLFGKNGSDVCTAAVRAARLFTGRRKVLFSGYHGWQDWYAETVAPELAAPGAAAAVFRFRLNDLDGFCRLVQAHAGEVGGVILEPAAQVEGVDGPVRDVDPAFLANVAAVCRDRGIVLIFDEILTGFRYRQGSVQQATGVVPDLTCLGKALTSGWPLSALLGRRDLLERTLGRLFYHPTFKGEAYSFAAALGALEVYAQQDVPGHVHAFGTRLKDGVNRLSRELGMAGRLTGQPYRLVYQFLEPDERRRTLKRTLLIQELLKGGILTFRGFLLPGLAHGEEELARTLHVYRAALEVVRQADADGSFARRLEIPLVV
jgi:glutamate-1-semialdehyde aminotransferase